MKIVLYNDYNSRFSGAGIIGSVTQTWGASAFRNGWKIIEVYEDNTDRKYSSNAEGLCEPARRESVSSERTWDDNKKRQSVLGAADGVARTLLATYYKIGTYNVFERGFMAVIEYEDTASDTEGMGGSAGGRCV